MDRMPAITSPECDPTKRQDEQLPALSAHARAWGIPSRRALTKAEAVAKFGYSPILSFTKE